MAVNRGLARRYERLFPQAPGSTGARDPWRDVDGAGWWPAQRPTAPARWWISHQAGGVCRFIPVWILGCVIVVVSGIIPRMA